MRHESLNEAIVECVRAGGGSKVVGAALWPAKGPDAAQRHLLNCLNPDRPEKLHLDELELVMRMARERGCHAGMQYLSAILGYAEPIPVNQEDEAAQLQRQFIESTRNLSKLAERIEQLQGGRNGG